MFFFFGKRGDSSGNSTPLEVGKTVNQGRPRGVTSDVTTAGDEEFHVAAGTKLCLVN